MPLFGQSGIKTASHKIAYIYAIHLAKDFPSAGNSATLFFSAYARGFFFFRILSTFNILKTMTFYWEGSTSRKKKAKKLIETCMLARWRQLVLLEWCQSLVVSSAIWDKVLNKLPSTGLWHPSYGGRCRKAVLRVWVQKWTEMNGHVFWAGWVCWRLYFVFTVMRLWRNLKSVAGPIPA